MTNTPSRLTRLLRFLELDPRNLALRLDAIRDALDAGSWDIARQLLDDGLLAYPHDPRLQELSGFSHLQAQRYVEAEQALRAALVAGPQTPELSHHLATALFMQRRHADALAQLDSLESAPGRSPGWVLRARCLHHLRRPVEAIAALESHLGAAPDDAEAHGLLALLSYDERRGDDATRKHVDAALHRNSRQLEALLTLASMQSDAHEIDAARASFREVLRVDSSCGRAWLGLALLNLREMRLTEARRDIEVAANHLPEHLGTWHVLAWVDLMLGDVVGAQSAFATALLLDRNFGETHGGLAVIAALQDREEDARISVRRALRLDPQSLSAKYAEILMLQREGRHREAQAALEALLSRPAGPGGQQYRELIVAQLQALRARADKPAPNSYH